MLEGGYFTFTLESDTRYKIMDKEMIRDMCKDVLGQGMRGRRWELKKRVWGVFFFHPLTAVAGF